MYNWWDTPNFFGDLRKARQEMNELFKGPTAPSGGVFPAVNVYDDGDNYYVRAEIPGMKKESLDITATHEQLVVQGERPDNREEDVSYHRRERDHGTFNRSFRLPQRVDPSKVEASYKNGVLEITVPRAAEAKPRKVEIQS